MVAFEEDGGATPESDFVAGGRNVGVWSAVTTVSLMGIAACCLRCYPWWVEYVLSPCFTREGGAGGTELSGDIGGSGGMPPVSVVRGDVTSLATSKSFFEQLLSRHMVKASLADGASS